MNTRNQTTGHAITIR